MVRQLTMRLPTPPPENESEVVGETATLEDQLEQEYGFDSSPAGSAAAIEVAVLYTSAS